MLEVEQVQELEQLDLAQVFRLMGEVQDGVDQLLAFVRDEHGRVGSTQAPRSKGTDER